MSSASPAPSKESFTPWWLVLIEGILAIIIGFYLILAPYRTFFYLVQILGIYWLISGVLTLILIIFDRSMWGWKLFTGIIGILAGAVVLRYPLGAAITVAPITIYIVAFLGIIYGIIFLIQAFRGGGWGVGILGVLSIIFGLILLGNTLVAALTLPFVLAVMGLLGGILAIVLAFVIRGRRREEAEMLGLQQAAPAAPPQPKPAQPMPSQPTPPSTPPVSAPMAGMGAGAAGVAAVAAAASQPAAQPEEATPAQVSEVEKNLEAAVDRQNPEEMAKFSQSLEYVEGIGPVYAEKLKGIGIVTPLDLLKGGAFPKGRAEIAEKSGISGKLILEWINHCDLYRIKGVGSEWADLLEEAGVDTVVELAQRNAQNLFEKMSEVNEAKKLVRRTPAVEQVEDWVRQAKSLPRVVNY